MLADSVEVQGQMESTPRPWGIEKTPVTLWVGPMRHDGRKIAEIVFYIHIDGYKTETIQKMKANAELICRAVNNFDALVEALKQARTQLLFSKTTRNSLPRDERMAWMDKITALIASAEGDSSVRNAPDSSSASSVSSSKISPAPPTKGTNQ